MNMYKNSLGGMIHHLLWPQKTFVEIFFLHESLNLEKELSLKSQPAPVD